AAAAVVAKLAAMKSSRYSQAPSKDMAPGPGPAAVFVSAGVRTWSASSSTSLGDMVGPRGEAVAAAKLPGALAIPAPPARVAAAFLGGRMKEAAGAWPPVVT